MKEIFTCLLLFVFVFIGHGQDYVPMLSANACWARKYVDNISLPPITEQRGFYYINLNSTEVISGIEYTALFNDYDSVEQNFPIGYLREDVVLQKVFYLNVDEEFSWLNCGGEEILLYDFSAEVGDTVYHCPDLDSYYIVQNIETVEEYTNPEIDFFSFGGGRVYEVFSPAFNLSIIYEGVGSNIGPLHEPYNVSTPGNEVLDSYTFGCEFIVDIDDLHKSKVEIYPNPVQNILNIQVGEEHALSEVKIYDLSGQLQMTNKILEDNHSIKIKNLTNGFYFIIGYDKKATEIFHQRFMKIK